MAAPAEIDQHTLPSKIESSEKKSCHDGTLPSGESTGISESDKQHLVDERLSETTSSGAVFVPASIRDEHSSHQQTTESGEHDTYEAPSKSLGTLEEEESSERKVLGREFKSEINEICKKCEESAYCLAIEPVMTIWARKDEVPRALPPLPAISNFTLSKWMEVQENFSFLPTLPVDGEQNKDQTIRSQQLAKAIHQTQSRPVHFGLMDGVGRILFGTLAELKATYGWTAKTIDSDLIVYLADINKAMNRFHEWMLPKQGLSIERCNVCPTDADRGAKDRRGHSIKTPFTRQKTLHVMYFNFSEAKIGHHDKDSFEEGTYIGKKLECLSADNQFKGVADTTSAMRTKNPTIQVMLSFSAAHGQGDPSIQKLKHHGVTLHRRLTERGDFYTYWI